MKIRIQILNKPAFYFSLFFFMAISCSEKLITKNDTSTPDKIEKNVVSKIQDLSKNQILVCAHRAYHKNAPENSLESIRQAIEEEIDIVEVDVNTTKDGVLVLMHDNEIDRTTNGQGYLSDYTYVELQKFDLTFNGKITKHKIPTLNQVLTLAKGKIMLNLDIKRVDVTKLYQQLKVNKMQNEVFSFIWDKRKIDKILEIDASYAVLPEVSNRAEMIYYLENIKSKLQHFNEKSFTQENVNWAKNNEILVFMNILWEPDAQFLNNNTKQVDDIIALQPAIIQTDHPKKVLAYLRSKNLHN